MWQDRVKYSARLEYMAPLRRGLAHCQKCEAWFADCLDTSGQGGPLVYQTLQHQLVLEWNKGVSQADKPRAVLRFDHGFQLRDDGLWVMARRAKERQRYKRIEAEGAFYPRVDQMLGRYENHWTNCWPNCDGKGHMRCSESDHGPNCCFLAFPFQALKPMVKMVITSGEMPDDDEERRPQRGASRPVKEPSPLLRRRQVFTPGGLGSGYPTPHELPAFAACPRCDAVNRISASALGIDLAPYRRDVILQEA